MESKRNGVNKIKKASALSYTPGDDNAPKVVASGKGEIAHKIIEKAHEAKIPVYEDPHLAEALSHISLGDEIPVGLYEVVAEILAFISRLDESYKVNQKN
ncbi:MAG: EscU/YscU/HrcU family type III secretion system export apparatus switch protein [Clostridiaceae bacterium]|jgi:flagellar biosynthesis protein|nr:EscU/YscU/HrcU family type III secretion system export apparatus switch protein [Clostridiaceae bacterium]